VRELGKAAEEHNKARDACYDTFRELTQVKEQYFLTVIRSLQEQNAKLSNNGPTTPTRKNNISTIHE